MSEIGLVMTGMLTTGQPSLPNVPVQQPKQVENDEQKSLQSQSSPLIPTAQITPPEFIRTDGVSPSTPSALTQKNQNLLKKITKKLPSLNASGLPKTRDSPDVVAKNQAPGSQLTRLNNQSLPILRFGSTGAAVRVLQRLLISNGYVMRVDGIFGPLTETAIKAFQNRRRLRPDGIVGQKTWRELTN